MTAYELAAGDEPVEVTVTDDVVTVSLGPLSLAFTTHRDQDPWDDREELLAALTAVRGPILEAVDRQKFVHAVHQAMIVLYAKQFGISPSHASRSLRLDGTEDDLMALEPEEGEAVERSRQDARSLLDAVLTSAGWSSRGGVVGLPPAGKARLVNLDTGELIQTHAVTRKQDRGLTFWEWQWRDVNDMLVEPDRPGEWWRIVGAVRELPHDWWLEELGYALGSQSWPEK